jgi:hypothetical protein
VLTERGTALRSVVTLRRFMQTDDSPSQAGCPQTREGFATNHAPAIRGAVTAWLSQARRDAALRELFDTELDPKSSGAHRSAEGVACAIGASVVRAGLFLIVLRAPLG